jgi:L-threonylcarbamoyladenylate synthase
VRYLSKDANLNEIAKKLFANLIELDQQGLDLILIDRCEEEGIGKAIMDRINRAIYQE